MLESESVEEFIFTAETNLSARDLVMCWETHPQVGDHIRLVWMTGEDKLDELKQAAINGIVVFSKDAIMTTPASSLPDYRLVESTNTDGSKQLWYIHFQDAIDKQPLVKLGMLSSTIGGHLNRSRKFLEIHPTGVIAFYKRPTDEQLVSLLGKPPVNKPEPVEPTPEPVTPAATIPATNGIEKHEQEPTPAPAEPEPAAPEPAAIPAASIPATNGTGQENQEKPDTEKAKNDRTENYMRMQSHWMEQAERGEIPDVFLQVAASTVMQFDNEFSFVLMTDMMAANPEAEKRIKTLNGDTMKACWNWVLLCINPPESIIKMMPPSEQQEYQKLKLTTVDLQLLMEVAIQMNFTKTQFYLAAKELYPNREAAEAALQEMYKQRNV